jgi:ketosteroid isomerase-like protein
MPLPPARPERAAMLASADDVEAQFYEALVHADLERLMAVWSDDDEAVCVHPGGPRVSGHAEVRASFEAIFANGAVPVRLHAVRRVESGGCSIHHVIERVEVPTAEGPRSAWVLATNVYWKTALGWRLVLHHASPGTTTEPATPGPEPTASRATLH